VARDVIFVDDVADVIGLLFDRFDIHFDIFNLGYGKITTVGEVVDMVLQRAEHHPQRVIYTDEMPTTILLRALNCDKVKRTLNWEPKHTVYDGISVTMDWWQRNKESWKK
jgi:nucleoside-diphosphate-sugar epimerase